MILRLQQGIKALLSDAFANDSELNGVNLSVGPLIGTGNPSLTISGGDTKIEARGQDFTSSEARPLGMQEKILFIAGTSYTLKQTPLKGTVEVRLVFGAGTPDEHAQKLSEEGKDFGIDFTNKRLSILAGPITDNPTHLRVAYSYLGVAIIQEFRQEMFVEISSSDIDIREKLTVLTAAIIITHHDELIKGFNSSSKYSVGAYVSELSIGQISWLENKIVQSGADTLVKMCFSVSGQIKSVRARGFDGADFIKSIRSPGAVKQSNGGVNIVPELG